MSIRSTLQIPNPFLCRFVNSSKVFVWQIVHLSLAESTICSSFHLFSTSTERSRSLPQEVSLNGWLFYPKTNATGTVYYFAYGKYIPCFLGVDCASCSWSFVAEHLTFFPSQVHFPGQKVWSRCLWQPQRPKSRHVFQLYRSDTFPYRYCRSFIVSSPIPLTGSPSRLHFRWGKKILHQTKLCN